MQMIQLTNIKCIEGSPDVDNNVIDKWYRCVVIVQLWEANNIFRDYPQSGEEVMQQWCRSGAGAVQKWCKSSEEAVQKQWGKN